MCCPQGGISQAHLRLCLLGGVSLLMYTQMDPSRTTGRPGSQAPGPAPGLTCYETSDDLGSPTYRWADNPSPTHHRI